MSDPKKISRRAMIQVGLGASAGVLAGNLSAKTPAGESCDTPAQPAGPFYPKQDQLDKDIDLTLIEGHSEQAEGEVVYVTGQVLDDEHKPVQGALVEIWQANTHGRYHHEDDPNPAPADPHFQGWGQVRTDEGGNYGFKTIIPGPYPVDEKWWRPPHIHFKVAKRGYHELTTQMYFAGQPLNEKDRLLLGVPPEERSKLIVELADGGPDVEPGAKRGRFNILLSRVPRAAAAS